MAVKSSDFLSFNDGVAFFFSVENASEEGDRAKYKLVPKAKVRFEYRTVGLQRFFDAAQVKVTVAKVIVTPLISSINPQDVVTIGDNQYIIQMKQERYDTRPASMLLTLSETEEDYERE